MPDISEEALAVLVVRAPLKLARQVRARHLPPLPQFVPVLRYRRIASSAPDVLLRDSQAALERPELVHPPDVEHNGCLCSADADHTPILVQRQLRPSPHDELRPTVACTALLASLYRDRGSSR